MNIIERAKHIVSVSEFESNVNPIEMKKIKAVCPYDEQYILRMVVSTDGLTYHLPIELRWMYPLYIAALKHQTEVIGIKHPFCYITVRHGLVKSITDDEWHVDGFSTKIVHVPEQNYIWSNSIPTEYTNVSVKFPDDFDSNIHNVNHYLQKFVHNDEVQQCKENVLYCLDPYILHRRPSSSTGEVRTFVRISFVPIEINDVNNTQNKLLPRTYNNDGVQVRNKLRTYG
ncbi:hypothetical protein pEaSNUABM50_00452 [Erwinia phage pEa_SNUABM_50]|uniref:Uncharacterized protein n=4 Tax=Eneladusvirus BF TaxID=2560751 RepID=A0A7L8ZN58_9CAUD|nr:hypothetical protein FDH34_gp476 [Serratia phage BF]QOI71383.1 hypothetical protein pEaSNUABM12_00457 [Erwinia phage pEa_SNUABM_12]QOI71925.1 hypothetical protein pEaSNUABM47_00453 [Erwinia phage pEa_SNUABM_47]QOI72465.1 hypothetical protein pEaSNUABM50_00452 [Erwinia phage pEa_SNUABM_50]QXO11591.1 hypothetical protein pEaSNUABM19_00457 [Erwinia phage pEa_SNUABM_19]QXO12139.1 hypothetical protein pEaSNUABM44_00455 [Erwinia phage pEa_SNUABM_44]QXO12693.1 hypothetical protein pEaSNUABM49_004